MVSAEAWHVTVQRFHQWRPLCRLWPLQAEVRDRIIDLGCVRRGYRGGRRSRGRLFVNNDTRRSADAISTMATSRLRRSAASNALQLYCGHRETPVSVLRQIQLLTNSRQAAVSHCQSAQRPVPRQQVRVDMRLNRIERPTLFCSCRIVARVGILPGRRGRDTARLPMHR